MRQFLALQLCFHTCLLLAGNVDRNAEDSRDCVIRAAACAAAARGDPSHRTVQQDDAKLGLITSAILQRVLDRGGALGLKPKSP